MKSLTEKIKNSSITEIAEFRKRVSSQTAFVILKDLIKSGDDTITGLVNEIFKYSSSEEEAIGLCFMVDAVKENPSLIEMFQILSNYGKPKKRDVPFSVIPEEKIDDILENVAKGRLKRGNFGEIISSYLQFEEACIEGLCVLIFQCLTALNNKKS